MIEVLVNDYAIRGQEPGVDLLSNRGLSDRKIYESTEMIEMVEQMVMVGVVEVAKGVGKVMAGFHHNSQ